MLQAVSLLCLMQAVEELVKSKLEKPKRLAELASRWWSEIFSEMYIFDRQQEESDMLQVGSGLVS